MGIISKVNKSLERMQKSIVIIPARGGSKRIPKKNLKNFLGKEIISYPIKTAIQSNLFSDIIVSTDDPRIAEIAIKEGASVPFMRSKKNSDDHASTFDVIKEVLGQLKQKYSFTCCLYPTSVFARSSHLTEALNVLETKRNISSVSSVVEYSHPIERRLSIKNKSIQVVDREKFNNRSQDLKVYYHDAGQFYFSKTSDLLREETMVLENSYPIILSNHESQDIDNPEDWVVAEIKYSNLTNEKDNTLR